MSGTAFARTAVFRDGPQKPPRSSGQQEYADQHRNRLPYRPQIIIELCRICETGPYGDAWDAWGAKRLKNLGSRIWFTRIGHAMGESMLELLAARK